MRKRIAQFMIPQYLCAFCAAQVRREFPQQYARHTLRLFSTRSARQKPPKAAVAAIEEDEEYDPYASGWEKLEKTRTLKTKDSTEIQLPATGQSSRGQRDERRVASAAQNSTWNYQYRPETSQPALRESGTGSDGFKRLDLKFDASWLEPEVPRSSEGFQQAPSPKFTRPLPAEGLSRVPQRSGASRSHEAFSSRKNIRNRQVLTRDHNEDQFDLDEEEHARRRQTRREKAQRRKKMEKGRGPSTPIILPEFISVSNLAMVLKVRMEKFLDKMESLGFEDLTNDHVLDAETAGLVATEFNFEPIIEKDDQKDIKPQQQPLDRSNLPTRPPVVTIMGHVDHGKTTMLDFLRQSSVAASEHGGITQHIGAFSVPMSGGRLVTFLDTPGHEAFLSMRQRGANVTDLVVLVVAADDSVKPQTIEAIKHAKSAKVPMIVAINKVDKPEADSDRVKHDLARHGVEIEDFGGDTQVVCVSGKTGQGMHELEDAIVALADILDVRAETSGQVEGWVLEAATSKEDGRIATILVRRGTLKIGDVIVAGQSWARVRSLRNEAGASVPSAGPGTPVEIDGWREQPVAGDEVLQASDEQKAKSVLEYRRTNSERGQLAKDVSAVNDSRKQEAEKRQLLKQAKEEAQSKGQDPSRIDMESILPSSPVDSSIQQVYFIIKADVSGSGEAVADSISALGNNEIRGHILRVGVGTVTEFDVEHAAAAGGHIVNFNTPLDVRMQRMAESKGVRILDQSIIYRLIDDVKMVLQERLPPVITQRVIGEAEIAQVFQINIKGRQHISVAGCRVRNGEIARKHKVRVLRNREIVFTGFLSSLKNVKKDISEARKGTECGMGFEEWQDFREGDQVQCYEEKEEMRTL